jgi:hypothetical protein
VLVRHHQQRHSDLLMVRVFSASGDSLGWAFSGYMAGFATSKAGSDVGQVRALLYGELL